MILIKCEKYEFEAFVFNCQMLIMIKFAWWWKWKSYVDADWLSDLGL